MVRMRTIPEAIKALKAQDPDSYANEWWLRGLVHSGQLPCHHAGKRVLINLDALEAYLANPPAPAAEPEMTTGKIRKIGG